MSEKINVLTAAWNAYLKAFGGVAEERETAAIADRIPDTEMGLAEVILFVN
jgi:hypothetical protein